MTEAERRLLDALVSMVGTLKRPDRIWFDLQDPLTVVIHERLQAKWPGWMTEAWQEMELSDAAEARWRRFESKLKDHGVDVPALWSRFYETKEKATQ